MKVNWHSVAFLVISFNFLVSKNGENQYHTDVEQGQIVALRKNGLSLHNILKQLGYPFKGQLTISPQKGFMEIKKRSGRPRKTIA